jgi:FlgD Ig-like domain
MSSTQPVTTGDSATDESPAAFGTWLAVVVVAGLVLATAIAFAETERLKLVRSPILDTVVSTAFAPNCACRTETADIAFRLRRRGLMTVEVEATDGRPVRRLAAHEFGAGLVRFVWYGRGGAGQPAPQGVYKVKVQLWTEHRTIVLPNVIRLDRTAPTVAFTVAPRRIVPGQRLRVRYRLSKAAHPLLYVDGILAVQGRWPYLRSSVDWFGKVNGLHVRYGAHRLTMRARDIAGNLSQATAPVTVIVRDQRPPARARQRHRPLRHTGGKA